MGTVGLPNPDRQCSVILFSARLPEPSVARAFLFLPFLGCFDRLTDLLFLQGLWAL